MSSKIILEHVAYGAARQAGFGARLRKGHRPLGKGAENTDAVVAASDLADAWAQR